MSGNLLRVNSFFYRASAKCFSVYTTIICETAGISLIEIYLPRKKSLNCETKGNMLNCETKGSKDIIYELKVPHISMIFLSRPIFITVHAKQGLALRSSLKRA